MERKLIHFYCRHCRWDSSVVAIQRWMNSVVNMVWTTRCKKCRRELIRLIDNPNDTYYRLSRRTMAERRKFAHYLLQPGQEGYDELYPTLKLQQNKMEEEAELKKWEDKHREL